MSSLSFFFSFERYRTKIILGEVKSKGHKVRGPFHFARGYVTLLLENLPGIFAPGKYPWQNAIFLVVIEL